MSESDCNAIKFVKGQLTNLMHTESILYISYNV